MMSCIENESAKQCEIEKRQKCIAKCGLVIIDVTSELVSVPLMSDDRVVYFFPDTPFFWRYVYYCVIAFVCLQLSLTTVTCLLLCSSQLFSLRAFSRQKKMQLVERRNQMDYQIATRYRIMWFRKCSDLI